MALDLLIKYYGEPESDLPWHNKVLVMSPDMIQTEVLQKDTQSDPHGGKTYSTFSNTQLSDIWLGQLQVCYQHSAVLSHHTKSS